MTLVPVTILGGLPVIAEVWFSGPDYYGEYDAGVDCLYWQKRDGLPGKELPQSVMDRLWKYEEWWEAGVTEQASDWLSCNVPTRYSDGRVEGSYSAEYRRLNPIRDRDGARSAETACPAPVPQDRQARAEGIAKGDQA